MLKIQDLKVEIEGKEIIKGLNLEINKGEVHAIMGPNGAGKSTLSAVIAGREEYEVTGGTIEFDGKDIMDLAPEERAHAGVFLSFQYPVEIPGVSVTNFIKTALNESRKARGLDPMPAKDLLKLMRAKQQLLEMDKQFMSRSINEGFSGGEKKRNEIFQMAMLDPKLAILDETDSGLDIDALRIVANGVNEIISVHIDDELINMNDREVLEDLITGAVNEASKKVKEMAQEEMTQITGGIKIPGLFPPT